LELEELSLQSAVGKRQANVEAAMIQITHRTQRFPFVAGIQATDVHTDKQFAAHTEDLSLLGCSVETLTPFAEGTIISLRISQGGVNFIAQGKVAYSRPSNSGFSGFLVGTAYRRFP